MDLLRLRSVGVFHTHKKKSLLELGARGVLDVGVVFKICWHKVHLWVWKQELYSKVSFEQVQYIYPLPPLSS